MSFEIFNSEKIWLQLSLSAQEYLNIMQQRQNTVIRADDQTLIVLQGIDANALPEIQGSTFAKI